MRRAGRSAVAFGLSVAVLLGTTSAGAQTEGPDREALRNAIGVFVTNITRWDGKNIARWRTPVCPKVAGATAEQADYIRSRVMEVATSVHAPGSDDKNCQVNLLIFLTEQPGQLWSTLRTRNPKMFGRESAENIRRTVESTRPVVTWQNAALTSEGSPAVVRRSDSAPEYRLSDSRFRSSVSEGIYSVIVVVNTASTGTATFGQLADYIAMVSLARIDPRLDPDADFTGSPTILRLFARSPEGVPKRLTNWDEAFLKGLYRSGDTLLQQRADITRSMREELAP